MRHTGAKKQGICEDFEGDLQLKCDARDGCVSDGHMHGRDEQSGNGSIGDVVRFGNAASAPGPHRRSK